MRRSVLRTISLFLLSMSVIISMPACKDKPKDTEEYLEFSSGGQYHPSGYGEWRIRLCGDGSVIATHTVGGRAESTDVFIPTKSETRKLFSLFCAVDIKRLKSSVRPGMPDEVSYSLALKDGSGGYSRSIWINDARENPAIMDLVTYLEQLIEKYTEKRPVMR
jgi:hypothetical protein